MDRLARIGFVLVIVGISGVAHAQHDDGHLNANYSFEELRWPNGPCPANGGLINLADGWNSAFGSPDYYSACSNGSYPAFGVPQNRVGYQEPAFGDAYALIGCYSTVFPDAREYIWQELDTALVADKWYRLRFKVSLADSLNYAIKGIGGLLSVDNTRYWDKYDFFNIPSMIPGMEGPQVEFTDSVISDKEGWVEISDVFMANGGEKYLTIGSFNTDADEEIERVSNHPFTTFEKDESAYYLDNVILEEVNDPSGIEEPKVTDFSIYPNPANELVSLDFSLRQAQGRQIQPSFSRSLELTVEVFDLMGKRVYRETLRSAQGNKNIDVSGWTEGVYLITVMDEAGNRFSERLVVQR